MKSNRSKACDIPGRVKDTVFERDGGCCILCGKQGMPNAHYIPRSRGGLGVEENIVTLCIYCHNDYDFTPAREQLGRQIRSYLQEIYPDWEEARLIYHKY